MCNYLNASLRLRTGSRFIFISQGILESEGIYNWIPHRHTDIIVMKPPAQSISITQSNACSFKNHKCEAEEGSPIPMPLTWPKWVSGGQSLGHSRHVASMDPILLRAKEAHDNGHGESHAYFSNLRRLLCATPCYRSATPSPAQILLVYIFHETRSLRMLQCLSGTTQKVIEMSETNTCVRTWMAPVFAICLRFCIHVASPSLLYMFLVFKKSHLDFQFRRHLRFTGIESHLHFCYTFTWEVSALAGEVVVRYVDGTSGFRFGYSLVLFEYFVYLHL